MRKCSKCDKPAERFFIVHDVQIYSVLCQEHAEDVLARARKANMGLITEIGEEEVDLAEIHDFRQIHGMRSVSRVKSDPED